MRSTATDGTTPLVAGLALVLAALVLPPLWFLLRGSLYTTNALGEPGDFTFRYYLQLIQGRDFLHDLANSLIFAVGSTVLTLLLGGLMAWLVERTNMPGKPLAYIAALVSLGTPYLIYVIAWLFLVGKNGPVNGLIRALTGNPEAGLNIYSMGGMVVVEGCLWSPLAFLLLAPVFRMSNADFEEAARMAGAGLLRTLLLISMRLATPAFLAIALLSMVRALEAFEVPILVGEPGGINILTTEVYLDLEKKVPPDLGQASAFSIALLILTAGLIFSYSRLSRNASRYQTVTGKGFRPRTIDLGRARYLSLALLILNLTFTLLLPMAGLLWLSLMPFSQTISLRGLQLATTRNYATVIRSSDYLDLAWTTFRMAAGGATLAMALTMLCAWLAVRRRRFAWLLDQLAAIPLAFPGIVLGIALLQMFLSLPIHIYGTIAAFVVAFTIRFLPYGMRYAQSGIIQIHSELEEAAGVGGASLLTVFLRIVVPLCWPTIMAGWLFTFLLGARDLSMSILLASPSVQPVAVAMFDLWSNGQGPELAAFGLVWTAIMTIVASLMYFASRRTAL